LIGLSLRPADQNTGGAWIDGLNDVRVASEVQLIEGQNPFYAMHPHRCDQSGIMHLDAGYGVIHDDFPPLVVHRNGVHEQA
jgi:hypothetical protein